MAKVLLAEDEPGIRDTLGAFLTKAGHEVRIAKDSSGVLSLLNQGDIDLVLTDMILPELSGPELLKEIREHAPRVPLIVMTGEPDMETAAEAIRSRATDYLRKPVSSQSVVDTVNAAVNERAHNNVYERPLETERASLEHLEKMLEQRTREQHESEERLRVMEQRIGDMQKVIAELSRQVRGAVPAPEPEVPPRDRPGST